MEDILRPIYQERASMQSTQGILLIEKRIHDTPLTDTFDYILFVVVDEAEVPVFVKHYTYSERKTALHIVTVSQLKEWLLLGSNRKVVEWIQNGKAVYDRNEFIAGLKTEIREFPFYGRKMKIGLEFAKLIRRFMDGKALFENGHYLDAYNYVVHSLHHLARLEVIDQGFYPEVTVWEQVRHIKPEIYKLYEELVHSNESLEKRLELLFLASEFLIYSRTNSGSQHLIEVMERKSDAWSISELMEHDELLHYSVDLGVLLEYLIDRHLIEVEKVETKGKGIYHRLYKITGE